ncbi:LysR family transcriptional regulator [Beijerinckia indica]|uniref:LysR family transcriptional regulator n=1 Tax=Beijerinckia indica TaxID=533 RepID=UPI0005A2FC8D|nr:LysR family transcriptional regulator [Beijerinckia indica]
MIDKLEFLLALSREGHFGRAAEACGVTQPTLSAAIKHLEDMLGVRLVNRGSRFQGFTAEGERVLTWAQRIVADARAMRREVDGLRHGLNGHLRIAAIPTALPIIAALTTPFRARHPQVRFTVLGRASTQILSMIEAVEIDAGLTYLDNEPLGKVKSLPLYQEDYCLITATKTEPGQRDHITWSEAAALPLCLLSRDMQNRRIIDDLLGKTLTPDKIVLETDSLTVLLTHIQTGSWTSVMSRKLAETLGDLPGLVSIPLVEPVVKHLIGLVAPANEPMIPLTAALFTEARQLAKTLYGAGGHS